MKSYKASEINDVNGATVEPGTASGRRLEVSSTVIMRNPLLSSSNTQHDTRHLSSQLEQKVFNVREIRGDGNCLFRAVSLHLYKTQEKHLKLRLEAVTYIRRHWAELKDHIMLEDPAMRNERTYCYNMKQDKTYGTSVEILAMSETLKLDFNIYTVANRTKNNLFTTISQPTVIRRNSHNSCINLLLIGNTEMGHFELLEPLQQSKEKTTEHSDRTPAPHTKPAKEEINQLKRQGKQSKHQRQTVHHEQTKPERTKWTKDEYKEIIWCHMKTIETTGTANITNTFNLWQTRNLTSKHTLNPNTLAAQRRYILNNNKLTPEEIEAIKGSIRTPEQNQPEKDCKLLEDQDMISKVRTTTNEQAKEDNEPNHPKSQTSRGKTLQSEGNNDLETFILEVKRRMEKDSNTENEIQRPPLKKINKNKRAQQLIALGNNAIKEIMIENNEIVRNITELNKLIYATAESIQDILIPPNTNKQKKITTQVNPPWKVRIQNKINEMRKDLSQLKESAKDETSKSLKEKKEKLYRKYKIKNSRDHAQVMEKIKQLISAKAHRIKRYSERTNQYHQNKQFSNNASKFYNNILGKNKKVVTTPSKEEVHSYWETIWGRDTKHNREAQWIQNEYEKTAGVQQMAWKEITSEELKTTLNTAANWKTPGMDGIPNFWLKNLEAVHENLAVAYNELFTGKQITPAWLTKGKTYLLPKKEKTEQANNYRPITCLNNIYKTLTKIISERIYSHLSDNNLFPNEQKGSIKNTYGCKDHLLISKMIQKDCKNNRKNLSIAWIDYRKAFDSIPHSWLIETMKIYRLSPELLSFVTKIMSAWSTDLNLTSEQSTITVKNISIKNGIYQGDSLSPLLFCMALFPLSSIMSDTNTGYTCKNEKQKISHLLYVDDLKLIAKDDEELKEQLVKIKEFSVDIHMEFGLEKCAKATFQKGKLVSSQNIKIDDASTIQALEQHDVYKYLGIDEHDGVQHKKMKTKLKTEYYRRIRGVLKTELNAKNKMSAITALAIPVIQYSFGIIKWTLAEIRKMDRQTRKLLTMHGALHPRADVDRLYISRKKGGRGLLGIEASYNIATEGLKNYLKLKCRDKYLGMVYRQSFSADDNDDTVEDDTNNSSSDDDAQSHEPETKTVKRIKYKMKQQKEEERMNNWKNKEIHGQIVREAEKDTINEQQSWKWLSHSNLKAETEALITACQEQAIATNYMKARIMKTGNDPKCRLCRVHNETIHHVVAGCSILAKREYLERHNKVATHLHWNICREYNIKVKDRWYEHAPDPVIDTPDVTIIWDTQVQTDRTITANKPDIIIKNKKTNRCMLVDVAVPSDYNITQKVAEKRLKYKDLQIEIQRLWNMKTTIIPVVIGATGLIPSATCEAIKEVPGKHNILILQKTVVLSTAHIVRKIL